MHFFCHYYFQTVVTSFIIAHGRLVMIRLATLSRRLLKLSPRHDIKLRGKKWIDEKIQKINDPLIWKKENLTMVQLLDKWTSLLTFDSIKRDYRIAIWKVKSILNSSFERRLFKIGFVLFLKAVGMNGNRLKGLFYWSTHTHSVWSFIHLDCLAKKQ